jgi:hypothetical protein
MRVEISLILDQSVVRLASPEINHRSASGSLMTSNVGITARVHHARAFSDGRSLIAAAPIHVSEHAADAS